MAVTPNTYSPLWFRFFMPSETETSSQNDVDFLARQLPLPRYRRVLDLCCGYGRHALGLARLGFDVTGLDRDEDAIAEAKRRTRAAGQHIAYVKADMRDLAMLPETFDAVINMWQSLSYFDEAMNASVLRAIHDKLTPRGRFIVDMYNRAHFERNQGRKRQEIDSTSVESNGYMKDGRWHSEVAYRDASGTIIGTDHMEWQLYTPAEFNALASTCGFTPHLECAWWDETLAPSPDVGHMQIVLERP